MSVSSERPREPFALADGEDGEQRGRHQHRAGQPCARNAARLHGDDFVVCRQGAEPVHRAEKRRWIMLPGDGRDPEPTADRIEFTATGNWTFPAGTVFVKHFELPADERDPSVMRPLETRLLVVQTDGGVYGVTYKWNVVARNAGGSTTGPTWTFTTQAPTTTTTDPTGTPPPTSTKPGKRKGQNR